MIAITRGKYIGKRLGGLPNNEAEHFLRCTACGGWIAAVILAKQRGLADRPHLGA